jgi:hypothetical protein
MLAMQLIPPHIMHMPRCLSLCCLFSIGALGLVHAMPPDFGPNVMIFDPSMPTSQIQMAVDAIANQQISNQFGPQRYALLFMPGTYGTSLTPLNFQVGYYTAVAGLGLSPTTLSSTGPLTCTTSAMPPAAASRSITSGARCRT